jgi:SAM-dependent methyltransferase
MPLGCHYFVGPLLLSADILHRFVMSYEWEEPSGDTENLIRYLESWGLQEFRNEGSYYEWQRSILSDGQLQDLHRLLSHRHGGEHVASDMEFYDVLARPDLVPVFYAQRFHYFVTIGSSVWSRIPPADRVLDFGCGVGILTLFYAHQFPGIEFVGIDRSAQSIAMARREAEKRQLTNVRFEDAQVPHHSIPGVYDLILSTQALFQSEREPGFPSQSWSTFRRACDFQRQEQLEIRTGLQERLDALLSVLHPEGRMILFEKTWNLGRRILFQRSLAGRGLHPVSSPIFCRYRSLDEECIDGPLYEVARGSSKEDSFAWNEEPYRESGDTLYRCRGLPAVRMNRELARDHLLATVSGIHSTLGTWKFCFGFWHRTLIWGFYENSAGFQGLVLGGANDKALLLHLVDTVKKIQESDVERLIQDFWGHIPHADVDSSVPCYESHHSSAQDIFETLPSRQIQQESTFQGEEGRELHVELGTTNHLTYLYWANTFDQRQLVLMDEERAHVLRAYYRESLEQWDRSSA